MTVFAKLPALTENRRLRLWAFLALYISQGVPIGFASVAIPAWLAAKGTSVGDIGFVLGIASLPWGLKLVNGMVIDRFCYAPMGRKRAWVIGAQVAMLATFLVAVLLDPAPAELTILAAIGFILNLCATLSDVAVDGMAVDLIPDEEREQVNAWMAGGQTLGYSIVGAMSGITLAAGGVALAASACIVVVLLLTVIITLLRERPGERFLPWTAGAASAQCLDKTQARFLPILKLVFLSTLPWRTLLFLVGMAILVSSLSFAELFGPAFSVSKLGWGSEEYTNYYAATSIITALVVMICLAPLLNRFGTIRIFVTFSGVMAMANVAAFMLGTGAFGTLSMQLYITVFWAGMGGLFALLLAWSMNLTNPLVAASQFSLFMAVPNFTRSLALGGYGQFIENYGYDAAFLVVAASICVGVSLCLLAGYGRLGTVPIQARAERRAEDNAPFPHPATV